MAGFSRPTYNSTTACIAILDGNSFEAGQTQEQIQRYRSFGSPVILVYRDDTLQFWHFLNGQAVPKEQKKINELDEFFEKYKDKFSPSSISRAKTLGQFDKISRQLSFHDFGLMPIIEKHEGEYLSELIKDTINTLGKKAGISQDSDEDCRWLTQAAFWLFGAKILKDKKVKDFETLNISDIDSLSEKINRHYDTNTPLDITNPKKKNALEYVASNILEPISSFSHLSINSLAYVYENTLITKATRKALGTHATPSWLVNYIVWQLVDWIEQIPQKDRVIFEPTCGHAPFLTAGARILSFLYRGKENKRHEYLKNHLIGIEKDPFAKEIARLALTLADIPNKDGWELLDADIYNSDILKDAAQRANILLCNPPFENFSPDEKQECHDLKTGNKAAEVLARTLPYMPPRSVFGVILPQGFLHKDNLSPLRKMLIEQFELKEICTLPENVFSYAKHKSMVLLGRKRDGAKRTFVFSKKMCLRRIPKWELNRFKESYQASTDEIFQSKFNISPIYDFRLPQLHEVWEYCLCFPRLKEKANVGKGLEYKSMCPKGEKYDIKKHLPLNALTISKHEFPGAIKGYAKFKEGIKLTEKLPLSWMNLDASVIRRPGFGMEQGSRQVLLNYGRVSLHPWRLKALIDCPGHPVTSSCLVIRPKTKGWQLEIFWALLNSPFANAFAYCNSLERLNLKKMVDNIPFPSCDISSLFHLSRLVQDYFDLYDSKGKILQSDVDAKEAKRRMLAIDAEVMRLYDLPPKLEWQVLNLFDGYKRKGVDFDFERYYPEGFESWIPLHEYLSEEYQRSTPSFVNEWVKKNRSPEVIRALKAAVEAFED